MKNGRIGKMALSVVRKFAPNVTKVRDADEDLLINVTDRDDKTSKRKSHGECAMAVALKRQEKATSVIISARTAYVIKGKEAIRYKVPEAASKEVVSFDRGAGFAPGDYKLKAQPKSGRLGAYRGKAGNSASTHNGGAAKRFIHRTANIREGLGAR